MVVDKFGYGSFHGTDLDERLARLGVRSLVVTGTVTQICVEETAREAFHHGYRRRWSPTPCRPSRRGSARRHAAELRHEVRLGRADGHGARLAVSREVVERLLGEHAGRARPLRDARPERRLARQDRDRRPFLALRRERARARQRHLLLGPRVLGRDRHGVRRGPDVRRPRRCGRTCRRSASCRTSPARHA